MFKVNNKNTSVWCLCKIWAYFSLFSDVSSVYFEQVNVCCEGKILNLIVFLKGFWSLLLIPLITRIVQATDVIILQEYVSPIQDGSFRGCAWIGEGKKAASLKSVTHTLHWWNLAPLFISYLKKIPKRYKSRDTPLQFCWHQHFFTGNQQFTLYQEIER